MCTSTCCNYMMTAVSDKWMFYPEKKLYSLTKSSRTTGTVGHISLWYSVIANPWSLIDGNKKNEPAVWVNVLID